MKKILIVIGIIIVALIGASFFFLGDKEGLKYKTDKIVRGDLRATVTASGTVNAVTTVLVGTQVSGTIKDIFVDYNSQVRKGQLISRIDPSLFEAQVEQARANLLSARANLSKNEASLLDARRTVERKRALFSEGLIAEIDLDTAETNYEIANAQITAAKAQIAQSDALLRTAETNLKYTMIRSPVDGIVVSRNVDIGQTVAASFQTPTLFTIAEDLTKMQINTNVDEADIGRIRVDQEVDFTVDAYPGTEFKGTVSQIRNAPLSVQNVVTYDVVVKVDNPELILKPGMTANVSIIVSSVRGILKVPNAALRFRPSDKIKTAGQSKGPGVWMAENGKLRRIALTTGISDGDYTEVLTGDIREGQDVIIESLVKKNQTAPVRGPRMF